MPASSVYFEATGARAVFEKILDVAGPNSRVCLTGVHKEAAKVDLVMLLAKEVSIIPAMGYETGVRRSDCDVGIRSDRSSGNDYPSASTVFNCRGVFPLRAIRS